MTNDDGVEWSGVKNVMGKVGGKEKETKRRRKKKENNALIRFMLKFLMQKCWFFLFFFFFHFSVMPDKRIVRWRERKEWKEREEETKGEKNNAVPISYANVQPVSN